MKEDRENFTVKGNLGSREGLFWGRYYRASWLLGKHPIAELLFPAPQSNVSNHIFIMKKKN